MKSLTWNFLSFASLSVFALFVSVTYAELPPEVLRCKENEMYCFPKRVMDILQTNPKGNEKYGLPPVEKLPLSNVILSDSKSNGPIQLQFKLNKADVYGIENITFNRIVGSEEDLDKVKYEIYGTIPNILIRGDYDTHGRVLLLPLNGKGDSEITLKNVKFGMKIKLGSQIKNGKRYAVLKNLKIQLEPDLMQVRLDNLFNGNKEFEESMNQLINENWKDIWNELRVGINKNVEKLINNLLKGIINKLSYDDLYKAE